MKWYFRLKGQPYAYGPIGPMTKKEAKDYIIRAWGNGKRMPYATEVWKAGR